MDLCVLCFCGEYSVNQILQITCVKKLKRLQKSPTLDPSLIQNIRQYWHTQSPFCKTLQRLAIAVQHKKRMCWRYVARIYIKKFTLSRAKPARSRLNTGQYACHACDELLILHQLNRRVLNRSSGYLQTEVAVYAVAPWITGLSKRKRKPR